MTQLSGKLSTNYCTSCYNATISYNSTIQNSNFCSNSTIGTYLDSFSINSLFSNRNIQATEIMIF